MTTSNNTTQAADKEIHEEFERRYAMDADDPASAIELGHFANGWRAAVSKLRAPITDLRPHLEWALRRIRTSLDTGDKYEAAQAALDAAVAAPVASAPVAGEPFMYGIMGPDGKAHFEEFCVSGDRSELQTEVVDHLNRDNPEGGTYSVVALFRDAAPQASPRDFAKLQSAYTAACDRIGELLASSSAAGRAQHPAIAPAEDGGRDTVALQRLCDILSKIVHNMVVAEQAAWIEWQHGEGAEAAMHWIGNGLAGPGHIPNEAEPYGKDAQAWYDANKADPFPTCYCGRPSNILHMGKGYCSTEHHDAATAYEGIKGASHE